MKLLIILFSLTLLAIIFSLSNSKVFAEVKEGYQGYCDVQDFNTSICGANSCCAISKCESKFCYKADEKEFWSVPHCNGNCSGSAWCNNDCSSPPPPPPPPTNTPIPTSTRTPTVPPTRAPTPTPTSSLSQPNIDQPFCSSMTVALPTGRSYVYAGEGVTVGATGVRNNTHIAIGMTSSSNPLCIGQGGYLLATTSRASYSTANRSYTQPVTVPGAAPPGLYTLFTNPAAEFNYGARTDHPYSWINSSNPASRRPENPYWCWGEPPLPTSRTQKTDPITGLTYYKLNTPGILCNSDRCDEVAQRENSDVLSNTGTCRTSLCICPTGKTCDANCNEVVGPTMTPTPTLRITLTPTPTPRFTPTPTIRVPTATNTPTATPTPGGWYFPAQVINAEDNSKGINARPVTGVVLELWASDKYPDPNPEDFFDLSGPGSECTSRIESPDPKYIDPGFCYPVLYSAQYHPYYLVKVKNSQNSAFLFDSSACTFNHTDRPKNNVLCNSLDNKNIRRGFFSKPDATNPNRSKGTYAGNVFYVGGALPSAWFQSAGGDVHAKMGIVDPIPAPPPPPAETPFLTDRLQAPNSSGVVSIGNKTLSLNSHPLSPPNRDFYVEDYKYANDRKYDYSYFSTLISPARRQKIEIVGLLPTFTLDGNRISGSGIDRQLTTLDNIWEVIGNLVIKKIDNNLGPQIIFVKGVTTVDVNPALTFSQTYPLIISQGDIKVNPLVQEINGIYITDGTFDSNTANIQLNLKNGTVVAWNTFNLKRNLSTNDQPAELFVFDPTYLIKLSNLVGKYYSRWQEVTP